MSRPAKTLDRVLSGSSDANLAFGDLSGLLKYLDFVERVRGSHHIFTREGVVEILNLQPKNGKAKPYQVKQVRDLIIRYGLALRIVGGEPEDPDTESTDE